MGCATRSTRGCARLSTDVPSGPSARSDIPPTLTDRVRLVGGALAAGGVVGSLGIVVALVFVGVQTAADTGFMLGTLAFGFGLVGWAGSIMAGDGLEAMQTHLDTDTGWTEADSRRAMARIGSFGAGLMLAAVVVGTALGYG